MIDKSFILGADEVGYGSLAGCVCVAGVRTPKNWCIDGLNDSKKLSDKKRRIMSDKLRMLASDKEISFAIECEQAWSIDEIGISKALKLCYNKVANALYQKDTIMIIDGNINFSNYLEAIDYQTIIKADTIIPTVMAASIIAKVYRDDIMIELSKEFLHYDWAKNKGYGSPNHIKAINEYGYCKYHRMSYKLKS